MKSQAYIHRLQEERVGPENLNFSRKKKTEEKGREEKPKYVNQPHEILHPGFRKRPRTYVNAFK